MQPGRSTLHICIFYHGKQTPAILPVLRKRGIPIVHSLHEYKLACPVYTLQRHGKNCELCVQGSLLNSIRHRCKDKSISRSLIMALESKTGRVLGDVRHVDRFICVSDFQREIIGRAGVPQEKLASLHNFIDPANYAVPVSNEGYFLYFGRIEKLKGLQTLVNAFAETGQNLIVAGEGSWKTDLVQKIADLPNISFIGFQSGQRLAKLIQNAGAVVVPSEWYENCPMSVLEAKAYGKPVIGARIGGIPELVRHGVDGFLFEAGNTNDLIGALNGMETVDHDAFAQASRSDAEARFSAASYLDSLMNIYIEAVQSRTEKTNRNRPKSVTEYRVKSDTYT